MKQFQQALADGDTRTAMRLLSLNPGLLEEPDEHGARPLMQAIMGMDRTLGCVSALLEAGADVNAANPEGYTALHYAVDFMGEIRSDTEPGQFIRLLVSAGGDIEARQHWGWTPLMRAVLKGTVEEVAALLAVGANPNVAFPKTTLPAFMRGRTLLMMAVTDKIRLSLLIEAGADVQAKDELEQTVFEYADDLLSEATDVEYKETIISCIKLLQARCPQAD